VSRIVVNEDFRIRVDMKDPYFSMSSRTADEIERGYRGAANAIIEQIKRHVDDVADVRFDFDAVPRCSKCGHEWEAWPEDETLCAYCEEPAAAE